MYETPEDLLNLQALLDQSIAQAGTFLRESFQMPTHSLSARQLVNLWQGLHTLAFATVSAQREPRVAPISALLFHGRFYIPTVATAARTRHVMRQPAVSFTYFQGDDLAIIAHGTATIIRPDHINFAALEALQREGSGQSVQEWGEGVFLQTAPAVLYTFARQPEVYTME